MAKPSRETIRASLRGTVVRVRRQVSRVVQRWLPLDDTRPPDHRAYITGDGQICCAAHEAQFERTARPWRPPPS